MKHSSPLLVVAIVLGLSILSAGASAQCISLTFQQGNTRAHGANFDSYSKTTTFSYEKGSREFYASQWTINSVATEMRGLIRYDLTQIPKGALITSAKLSLYADTGATNGYRGFPTYGTNNAGYLYRVTTAWNDTTVNWNTQPTITTINRVLLPQSANTAQDYTDLDVSAFVQAWVNNPSTNYGMELRLAGQQFYNSLIFCSSAHPNTDKWPKLEICYENPGCDITSAFNYQDLGTAVLQFNNQSSSPNGCYNSWVFYNSSGLFATSNMKQPTVNYAGKAPYSVSLTVVDSLLSPCYDFFYSQVDIVGNVDSFKKDTLCGYVFHDMNNDGVNNTNDEPASHTPVIVNGIVYYTDADGYYYISVGAGLHNIGVVPPYGWAPTTQANYTITTSSNQRICGFDFGINNSTTTSIIKEEIVDNSVKIFPNPANGTAFTVEIPHGFGAGTVQVTDVLGREVLVQRIDGELTKAHIGLNESVTSGIYTVILKNDTKLLSGRLSIVR